MHEGEARYDYSGPSYIYLTGAKENTAPWILLRRVIVQYFIYIISVL